MIEVEVRYFASMRSASGLASENLKLTDPDARMLYAQLRERYDWRFDPDSIRLAVNGRIVDWSQALEPGDERVFLPPFSGG